MAPKPAKKAQKPVKTDSMLEPTQQASSNANEEAAGVSMAANPDQILTAISQ